MNHINNTPFPRLVLRGPIVAAVILGLFNLAVPHASATVERLSVKSESQLRSEAGLYDTAIREISRIETIKLATADDFKPVRAILERQIPNLRFNRSKLVALGLGEATFINAAKARTKDSKTAEDFARELAADRQSIFKLSGGQSVKDKITRSFNADVAMLRRVTQYLEQAATRVKNQSPSHHAVLPILPATKNLEPNSQKAGDVIAAVVVTSLAISVVVIACPPLALALPFLATAAVGAVVTAVVSAGAVLIVAQVIVNVGTEQGRNKIAECIERNEARFAECSRQGAIVTALTCLPNYLAGAIACLATE